MISIIICSANAADLKLVQENISATIGVPHEVIAFDNGSGSKGICEIYNHGTKQAKFDILCFMHEDISFRTVNWGKKVLSIFKENEEIGLLGIAGGGYKSLTPSSWYNYHLQENGGFYANLIQGFKHTGKPDQHEYRNPKTESLSRVACIDGCWMCTRKTVAIRYPFDEKRLKKFHGYDLDFSIAVNQQYHVMVTFEVLLQHFSEGNFDSTWMDEIIKVHKKWGGFLPVNADNLNERDLKRVERDAYLGFLQRSLDSGYTHNQLLGLIWTTRRSRVASFSFPYKLMISLLKMKASV
jgi:glycosyltransferase involved in cell wall biosynthesis